MIDTNKSGENNAASPAPSHRQTPVHNPKNNTWLWAVIGAVAGIGVLVALLFAFGAFSGDKGKHQSDADEEEDDNDVEVTVEEEESDDGSTSLFGDRTKDDEQVRNDEQNDTNASKPGNGRVLDNLKNNMVYVEGGTFWMGGRDTQASTNDLPVHQVTLSPYYICRYEVTQEEWEEVMGYNPSAFTGAKLPVTNVDWNDCQDFIRRLNSRTNMNFRLLTEAEWEFAARGGNGGDSNDFRYSGSNDINRVAWYLDNSGDRPHDVGTKTSNELGLYDMSGNVWEWVQDRHATYSTSPATNPKGPASGQHYVGRGGSCHFGSKLSRVSYRSRGERTLKGFDLGFRLARD